MVPEGGVDRLTSAFCCHEYDCRRGGYYGTASSSG